MQAGSGPGSGGYRQADAMYRPPSLSGASTPQTHALSSQNYSARPSSHWSSGPRPMVHQYVPTTSSRTLQQQQNQQNQQTQQTTHIAPHLHPAYSGRGRPPLALGRRQPGTTPTTTKKTTHSSSSHASASAGTSHSNGNTAATTTNVGAALQPRSRKPLDGKEVSFLSTGSTNRLLLSLRSGLPSHTTWALNRLVYASCHNLEALSLDTFPGMTDTLLRFPRRLIAASKGEEVEKWEPTFWEQEEREVDGFGRGSWSNMHGEAQDSADEDVEDEEEDKDTHKKSLSRMGSKLLRDIPATFQPDSIPSHKRMLEQATAAMLILRNLSMNERNERVFLAYSRSMNGLICDILALPTRLSKQFLAEEWSETQGVHEMRIYALDILEVTRVRLHIRKRSSIVFDVRGEPISFPVYSEPVETDAVPVEASATGTNSTEDELLRAARRTAAATSDYLFDLLIWHLHTTSDRSILMGCLRCLGSLAAEERNEAAFMELDVPVAIPESQWKGAEKGTTLNGNSSTNFAFSSPGLLKKCLTLLPLTQDSALLEATLDCLYQIINIGDNALRLAVCLDDGLSPMGTGIGRPDQPQLESIGAERGAGDIRSIIRLLTRNLIYGRVVWDRSHQLTLNHALHGHVPSAVASRRKERDELYRKRRLAEGDDKERGKLRRLQRKEWLELKDKAEPERLKAWMKLIYEAKEGGEVTQMEFWTTYSNQFGPYATLGGPALQPAAEVIRTVSAVFPGALAMVIQNSKFIVRGVEARDRSFIRRFECRWQGCHAAETETHEAVEGHIKTHAGAASDGACHWSTCQYVVDDAALKSTRQEILYRHILTHLPETDEQIAAREAGEAKRLREEDLQVTKALKSQEIKKELMANGARYISGPTALMPNSTFAADRRRVEIERQEAKRRKVLNAPVRGTIDLPDILVFSVTRTPMDPETNKPIGISSTSGLILRSLARTTATVLIKAGLREKRKKESETGTQVGLGEKFGLPLPTSSSTTAATAAVSSNDADKSVSLGDADTGAAATTGGIGPLEEWAVRSAGRIMDALLEVEDQIMAVASENDILCPMLNETLVELKAEPGESMWSDYAVEGNEGEMEG